MLKLIIRILIVFFMAIMIIPSFAVAETIRVGIYQNPPLVGLSEEGVPEGFFVDILNFIAEKEDWQIDYQFDFLDEDFKKIENGEIDLLLAIAYSPERSNTYFFNQETIYTNWGQIYANKDEKIESFLDLEGKTLGVEKGDIHYIGPNGIKNLLEGFNVKVNYEEYPGRVEMFRDLESGKIDAIVVSRLFGEYYKSNYDIHLTPIQFNPIKIKMIAGSEQNQYLLDVIDCHLILMKNDDNSIYHTALNSFLSLDSKPKLSETALRLLLILVTTLIISSMGFIVSRRTIRKQNKDMIEQNNQLKRLINYQTELTAITKMEELFIELVNQLKLILNMDAINVVSILQKDDELVLDTRDFISGEYIQYENKNIDVVPFKYMNHEILNEFTRSNEKIKYLKHAVVAKFGSSYNNNGYLYIEADIKVIEKEIFSIYIFNVLLNLKSIITNIARNRDQMKLFVSLGELIEKRDASVANHVKRVSEATKYLAEKCKYSDERIYNIVIASSIHDIGKIYVPDYILNKPGKLTAEEFEIIKTHSTDSFKMIDDLNQSLSKMVHEVVRYHHENWDGTGYPEGLREEEIPHEARIVSVIDVFEALTHERPYKKAWLFEEASKYIFENRGIKFDPLIVDEFMKVNEEICRIFKKYPD
ncbi:MAG: transporter substrate-binding domain-containing protein [Clostridiales bacterium]|nr:transporter substrate-binding domain-containing protein [Clostridiales bacterium]